MEEAGRRGRGGREEEEEEEVALVCKNSVRFFLICLKYESITEWGTGHFAGINIPQCFAALMTATSRATAAHAVFY